MYFGMQRCPNPDDLSGNDIIDDTVGMFSMFFGVNETNSVGNTTYEKPFALVCSILPV